MTLLGALVVAFSMYTAIPMPKLEWTQKNMRYSMCFFPFAGLAVGLICCLWNFFAGALKIEGAFYGAVMAVLPALVTGGIHLDGFCDVTDALSSHKPREEKLAILKDSHTGAFAIIGLCCWFLLYFGLWSGFSPNLRDFGVLAVGFAFSRCLSGLGVVSLRCAKNSGLLYLFASSAEKRPVRVALIVEAVLCAAGMLLLSPMAGLAALLLGGLCFLYYRWKSYKEFGGVTGDLNGWFLQLCELSMLLGVVLAQRFALLF